MDNRKYHAYPMPVAVAADVLDVLKMKANQRPNFGENDTDVQIPRLFVRFEGFSEKNDFQLFGLSVVDALDSNPSAIVLLDGLKGNTDPQFSSRIKQAWSQLSMTEKQNTKKMIAKLISLDVVPIFPLVPAFEEQYHANLVGLLDHFFAHTTSTAEDAFISLLTNVFHWTNTYIKEIVARRISTSDVPVIFHGGVSGEEETLFLMLVASFGVDVILFSGTSNFTFNRLDAQQTFANVITFGNSYGEVSLTRNLPTRRVETVVRQAQNQLNEEVGSDTTYMYQPWKLIDRMATTVRLMTTFEEGLRLYGEKMYLRQHWRVTSDQVTLPTIFMKISGVHRDESLYWEQMNKFRDMPNVLFYENDLPSESYSKSTMVREYRILSERGIITEDDILNAPWFPYRRLQLHVQRRIAHSFIAAWETPRLARYTHGDAKYGALLLKTIMSLPQEIIAQLQNFDYPQENPKVVYYNPLGYDGVSEQDALFLDFLSYLGYDVIVISPNGERDVENHLGEGDFDIHRLDLMKYDYRWRTKLTQKGLAFTRLFRKGN